jgi:signal transduction histidine kinase
VVVLAAGGAMLASTAAVSAMLSVCLGAAVLFATAGFAAASRGARERAEHLLAVEESARVAREQAAALGERARLARELHDVLAHTLAGLTVQLRATRLLAGRTGADARLVGQLDTLQQLASDGMSSAKAVVTALRGDAMPGPELLPALIADRQAGTGAGVSLQTIGVPRRLAPDVGLAVYRTVQEALTNVAKHTGAEAKAAVTLSHLPGAVEVEVADSRSPRSVRH